MRLRLHDFKCDPLLQRRNMEHAACFALEKKNGASKEKRFMHSVVDYLFYFILGCCIGTIIIITCNLQALENTICCSCRWFSACTFLLFPFVMLINGFFIFHCIWVFVCWLETRNSSKYMAMHSSLVSFFLSNSSSLSRNLAFCAHTYFNRYWEEKKYEEWISKCIFNRMPCLQSYNYQLIIIKLSDTYVATSPSMAQWNPPNTKP